MGKALVNLITDELETLMIKIENSSILITDGKTRYRKFAEDSHLVLKQYAKDIIKYNIQMFYLSIYQLIKER